MKNISVSKQTVVIIGIFTIWIMVGLNRLHVVHSRDMVIAVSTPIPPTEMCTLQYEYHHMVYTHTYQNNMKIPYKVPVLLKPNKPEKYCFYTFISFWLPGIIVGIFFTAVWLVYCQVMYAHKNQITWMESSFNSIHNYYEHFKHQNR